MTMRALPARWAHARLADGHPWSTVNFDDHDWESDEPLLGQTPNASTAWKVAAGVAVGIVLGGTLVFAVDRYLPQWAFSEAAQVFGEAVREGAGKVEPAAQQAVREATAMEAEPASPEVVLRQAPPGSGEVAASAPSAAAVRVERRAEPSQGAAQKDIERKERAWAEHYKKPRHCVESPNADTLVDCANHYIRARREFEAAYMSGQH